ncbi:MAG TPA: alpha/beta fold hydrolase [Acidimicrobiales bacterium]|nr:alpha/beta fold hydrolase [Acidimicrobiales bacterium]
MTAPILPGAEPFSHDGGPLGVLVLHGFTGSPQSVRPQAEALAAAGYTVELPLWPGHGTSVEDMIPTRWPDWSEAAEAAFRDLAGRCDAVALFGLSMGGTLACWLAEHHPEIRGLCLVNPMVDPPAESFRDVLRAMLEGGAEVAPGVGSDIAMAGRQELAYPGTPLAAALSLFEGVDTVAAHLGQISCPVLVLSSREDHVVPSSSSDVLCAGVAGPAERVWLEKSYHVATLDHDEAEICHRAVEFAGRVLGAPSGDEMGARTPS